MNLFSTRPLRPSAAFARLARLTPDTVRSANLVHGSARAVQFELLGQRVSLSLDAESQDWPARWSMSARRGDSACAIELENLHALLPSAEFAAAGAPPEMRSTIAAQLAASAWAALGLPLPEPAVRVHAGRTDMAGPQAVRVGVRLENLRSGVCSRGRLAFAGVDAARAFATGLTRLSGTPVLAGLPVELRFHVGVARLSPAEWRALEPGDVVIHARLPTSGGRWRARVLAGQTRTEVAVGHVKGDSIVTERVQVNAPMAPARGQGELLDAVSVELAFEIGRRCLPLAELLRLAPGYVFELGGQPEGDVVDLTVNGVRVGRGQLVLVGEVLGVRVVQVQQDLPSGDTPSSPAAG